MTASQFEDRLRNAAASGRAAGEQAAGSGKYDPEDLPNITPDDEGLNPTEILLKVTGQKNLLDQEEADIIIGVFEDSFFDAITEYHED